MTAGALMTTYPVTVTPQATIAEAELSDVIGLLLEHKIGAIPVIRPDTQAVVGIVSYIDVLRAVQDSLEDE